MPLRNLIILSAIFLSVADVAALETSPWLNEGDLLAQTQVIQMSGKGGSTSHVYCDGVRVERETNGTCCELVLESDYWQDRTFQPGFRTIRYLRADPSSTHMDLSLPESEQTWMNNFDDYALHIKCDKSSNRSDVLKRAFGGLFVKVSRAKPLAKSILADAEHVVRLPFDLKSTDDSILLAPTVAIVTHASEAYDRENMTGAGTRKLLDIARDLRIPRVGVIDVKDGAAVQQYAPEQVNYLVHSPGGGVALKFPDTTNFIVGGGKVTMCLCETMRDVLRSATNADRTVNVYLVADAIFNNSAWLPNSSVNGRTILNFPMPTSKPTDADDETTSLFRLHDLVKAMANDTFALTKYLNRWIIGYPDYVKGKHISFCGQNPTQQPELDHAAMLYSIYLGNKHLSTVTHAVRPTRRVRLILTSTAELRGHLEYWRQRR